MSHHDHAAEPDGEPKRDEAFWDARYASAHALWSGDPNPQLIEEVAGLAPGRALDAGCGEGADAIWLASRGWSVLATDLSSVAIERARTHAAAAGPGVGERIEWVHADVEALSLAPRSFDLVTAQFLHLGPTQRGRVHHELAAAVAVGGRLLIVGHDPSDLETTVRRPPLRELFWDADDVVATLPVEEWRVVAAEARPRQVTDEHGATATVHDAVLSAERIAD